MFKLFILLFSSTLLGGLPAKADFGDASFPVDMFQDGPKSYHDAWCRKLKQECRVRFQGPAMFVDSRLVSWHALELKGCPPQSIPSRSLRLAGRIVNPHNHTRANVRSFRPPSAAASFPKAATKPETGSVHALAIRPDDFWGGLMY